MIECRLPFLNTPERLPKVLSNSLASDAFKEFLTLTGRMTNSHLLNE
jgi:hypothetical protein